MATSTSSGITTLTFVVVRARPCVSQTLTLQSATFTHRESGLCLDEPLEPYQSSDLAMLRTPTVRKCNRKRATQVGQ